MVLELHIGQANVLAVKKWKEKKSGKGKGGKSKAAPHGEPELVGDEEEAEEEEADEDEGADEVEIYRNDDGSYYYTDPESGNEIPCDEDGNELDEETVRKNLVEGIEKMSRIEELNMKLDSGEISPEEIEEFKKLLEEED